MRRYHLLLPLLFSANPVLFLYAHNFGQARLPEILLPLAASLLFGLLVLLVSRLFARDSGRAAIAASIFLVVFFSYGHAADALFSHRMGEPTEPVDFLLSPAVCLVTICLAALIAGQATDPRPVLNAFTVAAVALVATSLFQVVPAELTRKRPVLPRVAEADLRVSPDAPACKGTPPDIYYIVFDRYYGPEATEVILDFDNREFLDWLRRKGFYVADKSRTNYARTCLSLASSLNMVYLTDLVRQMGKDSPDETPTYQMLQDHALQRFLKARGYRYIHTGSWWDPTRFNRHADLKLGSPFVPLSQFSRLLLDTTLARPFLASLGLVPDSRLRHRVTTLYQLDQLRHVPARPGPKFVFAHLLLPHQPWVFGPKGQPLTLSQSMGDREGHCRDQFEYANLCARELIENILAHSPRPPIIILQADEGMDMGVMGERAVAVNGVKLTSGERYHFCILNAYYLPGMNQRELYPSISPVNSFRVVLNHYFGTHLAHLPDVSWYFSDVTRPYDQTDVTQAVR